MTDYRHDVGIQHAPWPISAAALEPGSPGKRPLVLCD